LPSPDDPAREAIAAVEREAIHRALWELSEEHRRAIALVDIAGFSTRDAARMLSVPRGTILSRLHRGRKALAQVLERQGFPRDQAEEREW
jgi:RNA polymerase sigma-70 factor (ECF subfamily)